MTDLTERLRLIAAWRQRGGPTPKQACPSVYETATEAATTLETLTQENARLRKCLNEIGLAAQVSVALCDDGDAEPFQMIAARARKSLGGGDE